jgi:hypothetical protein
VNAKLILIASSLILCTPAHADSYQTLATDGKETVLLDASSIRADGDEHSVRVVRDFQQRQLNRFDGEWYAHKSQVVVYGVDCENRRLALLEWSVHGSAHGRGQPLYVGRAKSPVYERGLKNLGDAALLDAVCTRLAQTQASTVVASTEQF